MQEPTAVFSRLLDRVVVLDMSSPYVFIGTLVSHDLHHVILEDADVHDLRDTATTRELYVLGAKRLGVRSNRKRVFVRCEEIVGVSALDDVLE